MRRLVSLFGPVALALLAAVAPVAHGAPALELAESVPEATTLDDPALPQAADVWRALFENADERIDISQFYLAPGPEGESQLRPLLELLEKRAKKGVQVRFLIDANFRATDWATVERLEKVKNIEVRRYDIKALTGGVQHAKYMLVDGKTGWIGSQNFDWRSLQHVQELGFTLHAPDAVADLQAVFELDWALAAGEAKPPAPAGDEPVAIQSVAKMGEDDVKIDVVASPKGLLPPGVRWDLPLMLEAIDGAQERVRIQIMTYALVGYDKQYWDELDRALRRAAARGVEVELMVADWNLSKSKQPHLKSLVVLPKVQVKYIQIPQLEGNFIEFGRVAHAKYMVIDGRWSWVGTSNWSRDYFHGSRNVGVIVEGEVLARQLDGWFEHTWTSPYAEVLRPARRYHAPPRTKRDLERERKRAGKPGAGGSTEE